MISTVCFACDDFCAAPIDVRENKPFLARHSLPSQRKRALGSIPIDPGRRRARTHTLEPIFREHFQIVLLSEFALPAPLNTHYGLLTRSLALSNRGTAHQRRNERMNEDGERKRDGKERNYYIILIMLCGINDFFSFFVSPSFGANVRRETNGN